MRSHETPVAGTQRSLPFAVMASAHSLRSSCLEVVEAHGNPVGSEQRTSLAIVISVIRRLPSLCRRVDDHACYARSYIAKVALAVGAQASTAFFQERTCNAWAIFRLKLLNAQELPATLDAIFSNSRILNGEKGDAAAMETMSGRTLTTSTIVRDF